MRKLPALFTTFGDRPDAIGTRVMAMALAFGPDDPVAAFRDLWRRTIVLREIAGHGTPRTLEDVGDLGMSRRASETIRFVIALGINLLDILQDGRSGIVLADHRGAVLDLLGLLHDATREARAIGGLILPGKERVSDHLVVRRFLYEREHVRGAKAVEVTVKVPLDEADAPTAGDMLFDRVSISPAFFQTLSLLRANGVDWDRVMRALGERRHRAARPRDRGATPKRGRAGQGDRSRRP